MKSPVVWRLSELVLEGSICWDWWEPSFKSGSCMVFATRLRPSPIERPSCVFYSYYFTQNTQNLVCRTSFMLAFWVPSRVKVLFHGREVNELMEDIEEPHYRIREMMRYANACILKIEWARKVTNASRILGWWTGLSAGEEGDLKEPKPRREIRAMDRSMVFVLHLTNGFAGSGFWPRKWENRPSRVDNI